MSQQPIAIHWFRQDLRLADNPSLAAAVLSGRVLPIYILDDVNAGEHKMGGASRWWLHHSLSALNDSLDGKLNIYQGEPCEIFKDLQQRFMVLSVSWNRCYEPWRIARDKKIKAMLGEEGIGVHSHNGSLLWEPWDVLKKDGSPYKVFTPFYRRGCLQKPAPRRPELAPSSLELIYDTEKSMSVSALALLPSIPWDKSLAPHWEIGEQGASKKLDAFIRRRANDYKEGRNYPAQKSVSGLSPHLHFGELSPQQVWDAMGKLPANDDIDCFQSEIGWREFSYSLLYHFPSLPRNSLQAKFERFPWIESADYLNAWQKGMTGYPLVDAGMRELWQTGSMHNRVRMVVGSFLVKNLLLHWHHGEKWFWDCLVDADLASNSAGWQWIAGCGADAAPYFRVFNPVTQGEKFDKQGEYTRRYVPELAALPDKYLFCPWEAPAGMLAAAGITLGETYPHPIVDVKVSRERALEAFRTLKNSAET